MIMKQNTRFIWIYGAILFSFALILILFAGLTQKESAHQEAKLSESLSSLAQENANLVAERDNLKIAVKDLNDQLYSARVEKDSIYAEKEAAIAAYGENIDLTRILLQAYHEKAAGNIDLAKASVADLDVKTMTEAQKYLYNLIIGE